MKRVFRRSSASLEEIFAFVRTFLGAEGITPDFANDLDLVLEELFTNLVKYSRGERGDIEIGMERSPNGVRAWLRETGAELFDPTAAPPVDLEQPIEERRIGGLGIHLVRKITEQFSYEWDDGVATTTVTLRIPR